MAVSKQHKAAYDKIRGLLCGTCNRVLGGFRDDICNLREAITYLGIYHG